MISDVDNNKVSIFNPNSVIITNTVVKLDVSAYDFSGFISGIVAQYDSGGPTDIPTIYELDDSGDLTENFGLFNDKIIHVKIPSIAAGNYLELTLTDKTNTYLITDVYDSYDGFETIEAGVWTQSWTAPSFTAEGEDTDGGIGFESTSQRVTLGYHNVPVELDSEDNYIKLCGDTSPYIQSVASYGIDTAIEIKLSEPYDGGLKVEQNNVQIYPNDNLLITKTEACYAELKIYPNTGNVSYVATPEVGYWLSDKHAVNAVDITTSAGLLKLSFISDVDTNKVDITWIRTRKYVEKELQQLHPTDLAILVEALPTDWYCFDTDDTSSSDMSYMNTKVAARAELKRCGLGNKKWKKFPMNTDMLMSEYGHGKKLNYNYTKTEI